MKWLVKSIEFDFEQDGLDFSSQINLVNKISSVPWIGKSPDDVADKIYKQYGWVLKSIDCIPIGPNKPKGFGKH